VNVTILAGIQSLKSIDTVSVFLYYQYFIQRSVQKLIEALFQNLFNNTIRITVFSFSKKIKYKA
jgi:hypothetical protein